MALKFQLTMLTYAYSAYVLLLTWVLIPTMLRQKRGRRRLSSWPVFMLMTSLQSINQSIHNFRVLQIIMGHGSWVVSGNVVYLL
jgi:hypothetical protein